MKNKEEMGAPGVLFIEEGEKEHHQDGATRFKVAWQRYTANRYGKGLEQVKE